MQSDEFVPYLKVFKQFGFGLRNQALLLCQCYPFDRFLLDGKPWVDYEEGINKQGIPTSQKRHRSLRSFQLFLGLGYTEKQSGDKRVKALGGSEVTRASLMLGHLQVSYQRGGTHIGWIKNSMKFAAMAGLSRVWRSQKFLESRKSSESFSKLSGCYSMSYSRN